MILYYNTKIYLKLYFDSRDSIEPQILRDSESKLLVNELNPRIYSVKKGKLSVVGSNFYLWQFKGQGLIKRQKSKTFIALILILFFTITK